MTSSENVTGATILDAARAPQIRAAAEASVGWCAMIGSDGGYFFDVAGQMLLGLDPGLPGW
jgi:hypothetical protein